LSRVDDLNAAAAAVEMDESVDERVEREVAALANPLAWVETVAYLADENVPGSHGFSAEALHTETLRVRVTSVSAGALSFFVCHEITSPHSAIHPQVDRAEAKRLIG
jgi:hypothetical protein